MNIWQIILRLAPFVKPYKFLVLISLCLTLIGAFAAQVNPLVLRYTVDTIQGLIDQNIHAQESTRLLVIISAISVRERIAEHRRQIRAEYDRRAAFALIFRASFHNTRLKKF